MTASGLPASDHGSQSGNEDVALEALVEPELLIAGVYQRHDWAVEKRAALDAWAAHVLAAAEGRSPTGNVVTLGRAG